MALPASPQPASVVPAQLGFLAIFNPSLGATDETIDDQIVYYASVNAQGQGIAAPRRRSRKNPARPTEGISQDERNERLRQIGLAQGMVDFSCGFANDKPVDVIETEKSRVVLRELEPGWWILASIDLTKLPLPPRLGAAAQDDTSENVEYSSREVKPAALLLQDLLRAHSTFLLHHAASLSALFVRSKRSKFVALLSRYWDLFLSTWSVMLHGNPACAMFGGIKMAACGELGVGVGEEDRGSGEREVLEGLVGRIEGLVDLVVSKFGDTEQSSGNEKAYASQSSQWLGTGEEPHAEDGAIFLGVGTLSKKSLRHISHWMEDVYTWGEDAYGVKESPTSTRTKAKRRRLQSVFGETITATKPSPEASASEVIPSNVQDQPINRPDDVNGDKTLDDNGGTSKIMSYFRKGWSLGSSEAKSDDPVPAKDRPPNASPKSSRPSVTDSIGHYLIGLQGDVEEDSSDNSELDREELDSRIVLRTLTVELENEAYGRLEADFTADLGSGNHELTATKSGRKDSADPTSYFDSQDRNKTKVMRVVVYTSKPFIYTFVFQNRTDSLAYDSLYKSLHYQLEPLRKPLSLSTLYRPDKPDAGAAASHIFDLIWDPQALTVHSTIPSIPNPISALLPEPKRQETWSRIEALNTHMQILQTYAGTRDDYSELERTCKTSRGWWVVWNRIYETKDVEAGEPHTPPQLPSEDSQDSTTSAQTRDSSFSAFPSITSDDAVPSIKHAGYERGSKRQRKRPKVSKEIFLIRRAGEGGSKARSLSQITENKEGWADGASRLAQGIGVDTKKYIEGLLSLA